MAVPASRRKDNGMTVHRALDDLVVHTLRKVGNPRRFGEVERTSYEYGERGELVAQTVERAGRAALAERIAQAALEASECAWRANDTVVRDQASYEDRRWLQERSVRACGTLLHLLNYAQPLCGLSGREVRHWCDLATRARSLLRRWRDSDRRRYGEEPARVRSGPGTRG